MHFFGWQSYRSCDLSTHTESIPETDIRPNFPDFYSAQFFELTVLINSKGTFTKHLFIIIFDVFVMGSWGPTLR